MLQSPCAENREHPQVKFLRSLKLFIFESLGGMTQLRSESHTQAKAGSCGDGSGTQ